MCTCNNAGSDDIHSKYYRCLCNCFHVVTCTKVLLIMHTVLAFFVLKWVHPFSVDWFPIPATILFCAFLGLALKKYVLMWPLVASAGLLFCISVIFAVVLLPFVLNDFGFFSHKTFELFYFHLDWFFRFYVYVFFGDLGRSDVQEYFSKHKEYLYVFFVIIQTLLIFLAIFSYWQMDTVARCALYLKKKYPDREESTKPAVTPEESTEIDFEV
uniref:Uncharacterized protein n=1 Tax=Plectus sambesii TaxID=2011161 RepID=A0A914VT39_9BILA